MKTSLLMSSSALFLAALGVTASFLPQEIARASGSSPDTPGVVSIQIAGALYLGFAILNWMARGNLLGGIYSRPVALGNFIHFAIAGVVLLKAAVAGHAAVSVVAGALVYTAFGVWFGMVVFTHPERPDNGSRT